jgi:hypothetical protein
MPVITTYASVVPRIALLGDSETRFNVNEVRNSKLYVKINELDYWTIISKVTKSSLVLSRGFNSHYKSV